MLLCCCVIGLVPYCCCWQHAPATQHVKVPCLPADRRGQLLLLLQSCGVPAAAAAGWPLLLLLLLLLLTAAVLICALAGSRRLAGLPL
jgi:hypothetical protein